MAIFDPLWNLFGASQSTPPATSTPSAGDRSYVDRKAQELAHLRAQARAQAERVKAEARARATPTTSPSGGGSSWVDGLTKLGQGLLQVVTAPPANQYDPTMYGYGYGYQQPPQPMSLNTVLILGAIGVGAVWYMSKPKRGR